MRKKDGKNLWICTQDQSGDLRQHGLPYFAMLFTLPAAEALLARDLIWRGRLTWCWVPPICATALLTALKIARFSAFILGSASNFLASSCNE